MYKLIAWRLLKLLRRNFRNMSIHIKILHDSISRSIGKLKRVPSPLFWNSLHLKIFNYSLIFIKNYIYQFYTCIAIIVRSRWVEYESIMFFEMNTYLKYFSVDKPKPLCVFGATSEQPRNRYSSSSSDFGVESSYIAQMQVLDEWNKDLYIFLMCS